MLTISPLGITAIVVGYNVAYFILVILHQVALKKAGVRFSLSNEYKHIMFSALAKGKILTKWGCLSVIKNIEPFIDCFLGSFIAASAIAIFSYAGKANLLIYGLIIMPFSSIFLPYLSKLAAKQDFTTLNLSVIQNLRLYIFLLVPVAGFMIFYRQEIIKLLFQRGAFDVLATQDTSLALAALSLSLPFLGILEVLKNAFAGQKKINELILVYSIGFIAKLLIGLSLVPQYGLVSLAVATTAYTMIVSILLMCFYFKSTRFVNANQIINSIGRAFACVLPASLSLWAMPETNIVTGFLLYVFVVLVAAWLLRHEDLRILLAKIRQVRTLS